MQKYEIRIIEAREGMVVAKDILNVQGDIIIKEGDTLTGASIGKLYVNDIESVYVFWNKKSVEEDLAEENPIFKESKLDYVRKIKEIKDVFKNIHSDIGIDKAKKLSLDIIESKKLTGDMIRCIMELKTVDEYIYTHSINVAGISYLIGNWMKLERSLLEDLVLAALLHDIGRIKIPPEILNKKTSLNEEEKRCLEKHPIYGYEILKGNSGLSKGVLDGVLMHHEREDGTGYPYKLKSDQISQIAKIVTVANIYCSMTIDRSTSKKYNHFDMFELFESPESRKFDYLSMYVLMKNIAQYYIGDKILLSNGEHAKIMFINDEFISKPLVKLMNGEVLDLQDHRNIRIEKIIF